jgi:hypothetical protein
MDEQRQNWLNFLALTTVLLAVGATVSTLNVGKFSNRSILKQTQASDQWAYYQAKSIKSYLYELQKEKLEIELKLIAGTAPKEVVEEYQKKVVGYTAQIKRYEVEKAEIMKEAKSLEQQRDEVALHGQSFGMAVILLQLAILLSSMATLMKKKALWMTGLVLGVVGVVYFANGVWLFM